ncbi:MAG: hypothetical protein ABR968_08355 [Bacteroidales bacterium]|jgi:hypothetical protein
MEEKVAESNRGLAIGLTVGYHVLLILFLLFFILHTPIPPYPDLGGGSGLEVNFGNSEHGLGDNKSEQLIPVDLKDISASKNENYLTHDQGEITDIKSSDNKTDNKNAIKINDPVVDNSKLYHKHNSNNQGIAGGQGNQGKENGDVNSSNYTGNGGSGGGTGSGNGTGIGNGEGPGTSYNLSGRKVKALAKPAYNSDEQGKIVVTITVDQNGTVTKAVAGARGTTISNQDMWKQAEKAALKSKFTAKSNAAIEQTGTITYIYLKLN